MSHNLQLQEKHRFIDGEKKRDTLSALILKHKKDKNNL